MITNKLKIVLIAITSLILTSCSQLSSIFPINSPSNDDFMSPQLRSILVLPPVNQTNNKKAFEIVLSQVTEPLAEKGYYVLPVAVTTEMLRQNGVLDADVAQKLPVARLREIFGADAALYLTITEFGKIYNGPETGSIITINALLTDLATGSPIWQGRTTANSNDGVASSNGGMFGSLFSPSNETLQPATTAELLVKQALKSLFSDETQFSDGPYLK